MIPRPLFQFLFLAIILLARGSAWYTLIYNEIIRKCPMILNWFEISAIYHVRRSYCCQFVSLFSSRVVLWNVNVPPEMNKCAASLPRKLFSKFNLIPKFNANRTFAVVRPNVIKKLVVKQLRPSHATRDGSHCIFKRRIQNNSQFVCFVCVSYNILVPSIN